MQEADYKAAQPVPLPTLAEVNDLGKPWRYTDGDYTVTEVATWSWRITPVNRTQTATFSADANRVTVTFGASSALTKWLNAFASVVNVITGTNG